LGVSVIKDGIVTHTGSVDSYWKSLLQRMQLKRFRGITGVVQKIEGRYSRKRKKKR
jgi:translation elongation factor EF-4